MESFWWGVGGYSKGLFVLGGGFVVASIERMLSGLDIERCETDESVVMMENKCSKLLAMLTEICADFTQPNARNPASLPRNLYHPPPPPPASAPRSPTAFPFSLH